MKGPAVNLRFESQAQANRLKRAAKLRRWSLNTFVLVAADAYADQVLTPSKGREQRIKASLEALDAPQPTTLTTEQWKEVVEEATE